MKLSLKTVVIFSVNLLLLICFAVCCICYTSLSGKLAAQHAAERWGGDSETAYSQISIFRGQDDAMNYGDINSLRSGVKSAMIDASLDPEKGGTLTNDAFCTTGKINVSSSRVKNVETTLYAVGGDYFAFHPLKLVQGTYINERDLSSDLVVIDRKLAWTLFGSVDVSGLTLSADGREYIVAGVVSRDSDKFSKRTDDTLSAIYMPYLALYDYNETNITSYETVIPNVVENFAVNTVKTLSQTGEIVENTGRFDLSSVSKLVFSFGSRSIKSDGIVLPHWESAARLCEDYLALIAVIAALFLVVPAVFTVILLVLIYKSLRKTGKRMVEKLKG